MSQVGVVDLEQGLYPSRTHLSDHAAENACYVEESYING